MNKMNKTLCFLRRNRLPRISIAARGKKTVVPIDTKKKDSFYISTPIYYVNADPHIGHLYSSLIADTLARWHQLSNKNTQIKFSTGTDEHGSKIQQASANNNMTPAEYCDRIVHSYKNLARTFDIDYTDFIRTTHESHLVTVNKFWNALSSKKHIYSANYEGWYCVSDETFLTSSQVKEIKDKDGNNILVSEESGHPVEWTEEKNYLFRLSQFQDDLVHWLKGNEQAVKPKKFYKILLDSIQREPLPDLSVSRPASRVSWGIPVPSDKSQTIYVWLDALVNYLTAAGYTNEGSFKKNWPPDIQVIGKDILKFHGIYWPAFLIAANLEPPHTLLCHSHWTVAMEKMSKSKGNIIDPFDRAEVFTNDGLRYFLLRVGVAQNDGNYNDSKAIRVLNAELADTLGNLLNRCTGTVLNPNQEFPKFDKKAFKKVTKMEVAAKLLENVKKLPGICENYYNEYYRIYKVADAVIATLHSANLFFETMKPWELRKQPEQKDTLDVTLHITMETLRVAGIILLPIVPGLATNLLNKLNIPENSRKFENTQILSWTSDFESRKLSPEKCLLFRRILLEDKPKMKRSE